MPNKKFWLNYALCWLALAGFWWWLQVGYFYIQHDRLKVRPLEIICLAAFTILMSMVSDFEYKSEKINPGIKLFVFKTLGPVLQGKFGFILPLFLLLVTGFLFFQSRQIHFTWGKMPPSAQVLVVTKDCVRDISGKTRGVDHSVFPVDRDLLKNGILEVRDEYGFWRQKRALSKVFSWGRYLTAKNYEIGDFMNTVEFNQPVKVTINFLSAENNHETDEGTIDPTSVCWKKFSPEGGISAFFSSMAEACYDQRESFLNSAYIWATHENIKYKCRLISRMHLEIIDTRVELTAAVLVELVGMARRIVGNESQQDYSDFNDLFFTFSPESKNIIVTRIVEDLAKAPGWKRELNRNNIIGMGNLLDLFTRVTNELNDESIKLLFTRALPLFDDYLGENRIILPMIALLRLSASIYGRNAKTETGEFYQNHLLAKLEAFFKSSSYNVIKWRFLYCVKGHQSDLPTNNSLVSYISCLKAILDSGTNYVRSTAADLISELHKKWTGNAEFDVLYNDFLVNKTKWPFTRQEVKLKIEQKTEKTEGEILVKVPK